MSTILLYQTECVAKFGNNFNSFSIIIVTAVATIHDFIAFFCPPHTTSECVPQNFSVIAFTTTLSVQQGEEERGAKNGAAHKIKRIKYRILTNILITCEWDFWMCRFFFGSISLSYPMYAVSRRMIAWKFTFFFSPSLFPAPRSFIVHRIVIDNKPGWNKQDN